MQGSFKRQIRLSQLAEKYIDMEVSPSREVTASTSKQRRISHEQASFSSDLPYFNHRHSQPTKEPSFTARKSVDGYEHIFREGSSSNHGQQWGGSRGEKHYNDYDQVALDIPRHYPARTNLPSDGYEPINLDPSEKNRVVLPDLHINEVPIGDYQPVDLQTPKKGPGNSLNFKSTGDGYEPIFLDSMEKSPHNCKIVVTPDNDHSDSLQKSAFLSVSSDGYLSSDSLDSIEPRDKYKRSQSLIANASKQPFLSSGESVYIDPNYTSTENLSKHFIKPIPKPGISSSITSLPDLYGESPNPSPIKKPKPQPVRRRAKSPLAVVEHETSASISTPQSEKKIKNTESRYNVPRPSAPAIFIQSAYSTNEDLKQIQAHLQMIAVGNSPNISPAESLDKMFVPKRGSMMLYDPPRISPPNSLTASPESSIESLQDEQSTGIRIYDIPRPSITSPDDLFMYPEK